MEYWKLHSNLARSLEDPMIKDNGEEYVQLDAFTNSPLPDGVRYSKELRDDYLFRACQGVLLQSIKAVAGMRRQEATHILTKMFPAMTRHYRVLFSALGVQPKDMLYIYAVRLVCPTKAYLGTLNKFHADPAHVDGPIPDIVTREVPLVETSEFSNIVASGTLYNNDLVACSTAYTASDNLAAGNYHWLQIGGNHTFHYLQWDTKYGSGDASNNEEGICLDVEYLPHMLPLIGWEPSYEVLDPVSGVPVRRDLSIVPFEPVWESTIITKALSLAHLDSGQLGAAFQSAPYLEKIPVVGG